MREERMIRAQIQNLIDYVVKSIREDRLTLEEIISYAKNSEVGDSNVSWIVHEINRRMYYGDNETDWDKLTDKAYERLSKECSPTDASGKGAPDVVNKGKENNRDVEATDGSHASQREAVPPVSPDNSSDNVFIEVKPNAIFSRPGSDLRYGLDITLEEAVSGCDKVLEIGRLVPCDACAASGSKDGTKGYKICSTCHGSGVITQQSGFSVQQSTCPSCSGLGQIINNPCPKCHGEGRVHKDVRIPLHVPPGVDTGTKLRSSGNGDAGIRGGKTGDLYFFIEVKPHAIFSRDGKDLFYTMTVPFALAAQGGVLSVPTPDGAVKMKLPAGTSSGTTFRVRGKGMPALGGGSRGDLMVEIQVETSTNYREGVKLLFGIGMERDLRRAVQCFREGYAKGDLNAGHMLAGCLSSGDGTARDFDESFQIASHLVDKGFCPAYYLVANAYTSGRGTALDPEKGEAYGSKVFEYCSEPLPGVDESIRFEALLDSMGLKDEVDWYAIERTARKYREISDWPTRHGRLALALLEMVDDVASPRPEVMEIIEAGCAENDVVSFSLKAIIQFAQEQYKEAQQTAKLGLKIVPGLPLLCDLMWKIAIRLNVKSYKVKQEFWKACALGTSVMSRSNDLGVRIEIETPSYAGFWIVYREDIAEKNKECIYQYQPVIVVKNTNDEMLEGATIRICSEDVKLDRTFPLKPISPHGEISLEEFDLGDIQYGEKLYVRVAKGNRYSEMALDTMQGLNDFRPSLMPLMMTWKSGTFGDYILQLKCLEGSLSNIVVTKQSGATAHIPTLEVTQGPASVGWREFSDGSCLTPLENFVVQCDGYAPISGFIKLL